MEMKRHLTDARLIASKTLIRLSAGERKSIRELIDRLENGRIGQADRDTAAALLRRAIGQTADGQRVKRGRPSKAAESQYTHNERVASGLSVELARVIHGESFQDAVTNAAEEQGKSERTIAANHKAFKEEITKLDLPNIPPDKLKFAAIMTQQMVNAPETVAADWLIATSVSNGVLLALDAHAVRRELWPAITKLPGFIAMENEAKSAAVSYFLNRAYPKGAARLELREAAEKLGFGHAYGALQLLKDGLNK